MCTMKKEKKLNSQAKAVGVKSISVRNIKKQEQGVSVCQPIPIWAQVNNPISDGIF